MRVIAFILLFSITTVLHAQGNGSGPLPLESVPLVGRWNLNLARTHYGNGVDVRRRETFDCEMSGARLNCTIRSIRQDGRELVGRFSAPLDGSPAPVTGISEMDSVELTRPNAVLLDATFFLRGKAVYAYRAYRSHDGRSLAIVSIDPETHAALTTVVVYDRQ